MKRKIVMKESASGSIFNTEYPTRPTASNTCATASPTTTIFTRSTRSSTAP